MNTSDRNLCIFSHFDRQSRVREYVHYYVQCLVSAGFRVIFVSTADQVVAADRDRLEAIGVEVHTRENVGLDFASWQYGLTLLDDVHSLERLILANDSVFGPLFDLKFLVDQMDMSGADFWGITDSYEIAWHLQSYFLVFSGEIVRSPTFKTFFETDFKNLTKRQIITKGEVGLSQALVQAGFHGAASCPYGLLLGETYRGPNNPTHYHWDRLVEELRCPFLKIQLVRDNPRSVQTIARWREVVSTATDFDIRMIEDHISAFGEAPPKHSIISAIFWYASRIPYVMGLALRALAKAVRNPLRAEMALERFVAVDLKEPPLHPAPRPMVAYSDLHDGSRRNVRQRSSAPASEAAE